MSLQDQGPECLSNLCNAKHPETLNSTQLSKHKATFCQIMNLKDHELDQVTKFMGHDIHVNIEAGLMGPTNVQKAIMHHV